MTWLPDSQLTAMREQVANTLFDTCTIQSKTTATDSSGFPVETWANVATGVRCRVDPLQTRDTVQLIAGQETLKRYRRLTVPYDTAIQPGYQVIFDGDTYQIAQLDDDQSARVVRRAILIEVGNG